MEVLNLLLLNEQISPKFLKKSPKILINLPKIKLSISLHVSRRSIRSKPCFIIIRNEVHVIELLLGGKKVVYSLYF